MIRFNRTVGFMGGRAAADSETVNWAILGKNTSKTKFWKLSFRSVLQRNL